MQTVVTKHEEDYVKTVLRNNLIEDESITIKIRGLVPERSLEDRDVFVEIGQETFWLRGEVAIEIGQKLIEHGTFALQVNMINHQHNFYVYRLREYIADGCVEKLTVTLVDDKPINYGPGHKMYNIKPVWKTVPKYQEDFNFDTVVYGDYSGISDYFNIECEEI